MITVARERRPFVPANWAWKKEAD